MMYFDVRKFPFVWDKFSGIGLTHAVQKYHGDQDLIGEILPRDRLRYFQDSFVQSWRWQIQDGGLDTRTRKPISPGTGCTVPADTAVMVFHGKPKPHEIQDSAIQNLWSV
jgi:hypothetical protein